MLVEHVSTEATAEERGHAFGELHAAAVRHTIAAYEGMFAALYGLSPAAVADLGRRAAPGIDPPYRAEIEAIARGAGAAPDSLMAINARTEIYAGGGVPECSAIGAGHLLAQNWDWHPDLIDSRVVWTIVEPDGSWLTTLTEAGILAKIGLNSRGVGLCLNILHSSLDGGVGGAPVHVLCRRILAEAGDLGEARAILRAAPATASSCFNVSDGSEMASFELSPAGVGEVAPADGVLLHTNHFLTPLGGAEDTGRADWPDSVDRLDELDARFRRGADAIGEDAIKAALQSHDAGPIAVCCHDLENPVHTDRVGTLASVFLDLDARRIELTDGTPCQAPYRPVERVPAAA